MSSSRSVIISRQIFTGGVMTGVAVINSLEVNVESFDRVSIEATWTGTPNGTFDVQGASQVDSSGVGVNFQPITLSSVPAATGAAGSHLIQLASLGVARIRLSYTNSSGAGSLNAWLTGKGV